MAQGKRNLGGLPAWDALDDLLARLRRGESLERCLEEYPHLADELRPLAYIVGELEEAKPAEVPAPAGGLERGRERFLAAAAQRDGSRRPEAAGDSVDGREAAWDDAALTTALRPAHRLDELPAAALARARQRFLTVAAAERQSVEELAAALRPAHALHAAPAPAPALARGRERFLAAAERQLVDEFATALQPARALDEVPAAALARIRERFLAAATAAPAQMGADVGTVADSAVGPAATLALVGAADGGAPAETATDRRARSRREAAGIRRERRHTEAGGLAAWLGRALGGASRFGPAELAMTAMAMLLFVMFSFSPVAAESLPGDVLYPVKRFGEQVRLISKVLSPDRYRDVAADIEAERVREVDRLVQAGREAEVSLRGRLASFRETTQPGEKPHGDLVLRVDGSGDGSESRTLSWDSDTSFDAGAFGHFSAVPSGTQVRVVMKTNSDGHPLVARKVVVREGPADGTPTPTATAALTVTATATLATPVDEEGTTTPTATQGALPIMPSPTLTLTRPTATVPVTNATETTPTADVQRPRNESRLLGVVLSMPDSATWRLRRLRVPDKSEVSADISQLGDDKRIGEVHVGFEVELVGRWKSRSGNGGVFIATGLKSARPADCQLSREEYIVSKIERDGAGNVVSLTLTDGTTYALGGQLAAGLLQQIAVGDTVAVTVQTCPYLNAPQITALNVTGKASDRPRQTLQGVVSQLNPDERRFVLSTDAGAKRTVTFDAATVIKGGSGQLRDGQLVTVAAVEAPNGDLEALSITILAEPMPTPTASPTANATPGPTLASKAPEPTKTVEPPNPPTPTPAGSTASTQSVEAAR